MEREREGLFENPEWHIDSLYSLTPDRGVLSVIAWLQPLITTVDRLQRLSGSGHFTWFQRSTRLAAR